MNKQTMKIRNLDSVIQHINKIYKDDDLEAVIMVFKKNKKSDLWKELGIEEIKG